MGDDAAVIGTLQVAIKELALVQNKGLIPCSHGGTSGGCTLCYLTAPGSSSSWSSLRVWVSEHRLEIGMHWYLVLEWSRATPGGD
jgi:hypothetical protein